MHRLSLISLTTMMMATLVAGNVNAQEAPPRKTTVGPAIEFGNGAAFGIQAKIPIGSNFSVRPIVLFGYQTKTIYSSSGSGSGSSSSGACTGACEATARFNAILSSPPLPLYF